MIRIIASFACAFAVYAAAVFVCLEPNVLNWTEHGRGALALFGTFAFASCYTCPAWWLK